MRRRCFNTIALSLVCSRTWADEPDTAGTKLDLSIGEGFGSASAADIRAVLMSAGNSIWQHCPNTRWDVPGFFIYHNGDYPITNYAHRPDGRIAIGLTTQGPYWAQFAFQFSHEFCHALAGHSNDWRKRKIQGPSANHWFEESLCEVASLFALRAMGKSWETAPPYPNWKSYGQALTTYAGDRMKESAKDLPETAPLIPWLKKNLTEMQRKSTLREKNNVVAGRLLPIFENEPSGWESVTWLNLVERKPQATVASHFAEWRANAPKTQRAFIGKLAATLGVRPAN